MNLFIFRSSYTVAVYCVSEEEIMGIYIMICWVVNRIPGRWRQQVLLKYLYLSTTLHVVTT
jgi:hypothetical protein